MSDGPGTRKLITVQQYLFGYQHGHRLLSGSRSISNELLQQIISRTDAPGANAKDHESTLLQGFPLVGVLQYALARTWSDRREGSRPGTVLTHLLLIDLPDLGREDISLPLLELLKDDPNETDFDQFRLPLQLETRRRARARVPEDLCRTMRSRELLPQLYESAYGPAEVMLTVTPSPVASSLMRSGAELFLAALWEQQWPRLRRSFSFVVTNWRASTLSPSRYHADLLLFIRETKEIRESSPVPRWVKTLENDLISPGALRQFLRRAGADIKSTRQIMQSLVDLHLRFQTKEWSPGAYHEIAEIIFSSFPNASDAKWLKKQLFDPSVWERHTDFKANEFIAAMLDMNRLHDRVTSPVDWPPLIYQAMQDDPVELSRTVAAAFDDEDVPLSEEFCDAYLDELSIHDLSPATDAQPFLLPAVVERHPSWLEREELWTALPGRQENLLNALHVLADRLESQLDWNKVLRNVANFSTTSSSGDWMRRIPLVAFEGFLKNLGDEEPTPQWIQGLNARIDDVIHWMATQDRPPLALLLWICLHVDFKAMWRPQLNDLWLQVAQDIQIYPIEYRSLLTTQALCTMITAEQIDPKALLQVLEIVRQEVIQDNLSSRHKWYLSDHLPRTKKDRDNWDIGRRLDYWAANVFSQSGVGEREVHSAFSHPTQAKRLFKLLKKHKNRTN